MTDRAPAPDAGISETIFALATAPGRAGIAVVRVSGPEADAVLLRVTGRPLPDPRRLVRRDILAADGALIDQGLAVRFESGASFTGEPVAELHCHGGRAVVGALLAALAGRPGCRMAEPGEFTRRAFEAGRLDLTEVEALGDLVAAETEMQRRQAIRGASGALYRQAQEWRESLIKAAALVEVTIDWADEEVPEDVAPEVGALVSSVHDGITHELAVSVGAEQVSTGFEVAIMGPPNAGKSSLFNALAGRDAAITSPQPGTTRDVLELRYDLNGLPVVFLDTAGLRESRDAIETCGVARAVARAEAASLRIFLSAGDAPTSALEETLYRPGDIRVWSKCDLGGGSGGGGGDLMISSLRGDGLPQLLGRVGAELAARAPADGLVSNLRQRTALEDAAGALARARDGVEGCEAETLAEELRVATRALAHLVGRIGVEDVLDSVFANFCLGK